MSTGWPSSTATSSMASSDSDWVMDTISPALKSTFTISAALTPSLSPSSWGLAPLWILIAAAGAAGSGAAGATSSSGGAITAVATFSSTCPLPAGGPAGSLASGAFLVGSWAAVAAFGLLPGLTFPPDARRRGTASSGTVDEAVRPS